MNRLRLGFGSWLSAMCVVSVVACHQDASSTGGAGGAKGDSAATKLCDAVKGFAAPCGTASECDQALVGDCTTLTGMLSDAYLNALSSCMKSGGAPFDCVAQSLGGLTPTDAQTAFAKQFCAECGLGIPGCESALFTGSGDTAQIGKLILPLSDSLVDALRTQCTTGATCAATFNSCAETVFATTALPEKTLSCVVESWTTGQGAQSGCTDGSGGAKSSTSVGPTSSAATSGQGGDSTTSTASTGTGDPTCVPTINDLPDTTDCETDTLIIQGTIGDQSLFILQHVSDSICALDPTVGAVVPSNLEVCQYLSCDSGNLSLTCPSGTTAETDANGHLGCCGNGQFAIDYGCLGTTDDSVEVTYEIKPYGSCGTFGVQVSY